MGPYPSGSGSEWAPPGHAQTPSPADLDGLLAGAGYRVRSSDLHDVARNLERLDSFIGSAAPPHELCGPHYNPSDLTAWVDSMLSDLTAHPDPTAIPNPPPPTYDTWTDQILPPPPPPPTTTQISTAVARHQEEEDTGIRLVHLLMSCADSVQRGEPRLAANLLEDLSLVLARANTGFGIGKVAGYFADAISRRLYSPDPAGPPAGSPEREILYHHFYEACPYLKFAHFTANQAILEAFDGHDRVHVVDFGLMQGLQWPALIQALALRPGGPPFLRLTGIGLADLAFRRVTVNRLDDVRPWILQVAAGEAIAVNFSSGRRHLQSGSRLGTVTKAVVDASTGPSSPPPTPSNDDHNEIEFISLQNFQQFLILVERARELCNCFFLNSFE